MFGRQKGWEDAEAVVVSADNSAYTSWKIGQWSYCKFDLVLDVSPATGPVFRAGAVERFPTLYGPLVGDRVTVRFDPQTREVDVRTADDPRWHPEARAQMEQQDRAAQRARDLAAPPGTPAGKGPGSVPPARPTPTQWQRDAAAAAAVEGLDPDLAELMRSEEGERTRRGPLP